jgi:hypothetical protein
MKRIIYIIAAVVLGILLGTIVHGIVEIKYLNYLFANGITPQSHPFLGTNCFLPPLWQFVFLIGGAILGYFLGVNWWRIVYIEKRHWRMRRK